MCLVYGVQSIAAIDNLRKISVESSERSERYDKIYAIEKTKWPHNMGSVPRSKVPNELHSELDACIEKSQHIAREACQTADLTDAYIKDNSS